MAFENRSVGLHNVGSYQVSGVPYITGSQKVDGAFIDPSLTAAKEMKYVFPQVAKSVTVTNYSAQDIRVHFNSRTAGDDPGGGGSDRVVSGSHFVLLEASGDTVTFNTKCKQIYVSAPEANSAAAVFTVRAELTGIPSSNMYVLTGSGFTD